MKSALVRLAFAAALLREPTPAELANWAGNIADDLSNLDAIIGQILDAPEAKAIRATLSTMIATNRQNVGALRLALGLPPA